MASAPLRNSILNCNTVDEQIILRLLAAVATYTTVKKKDT